LPDLLPEMCKGSAKDFLDLFDLKTPQEGQELRDSGLDPLLKSVGTARIMTPIQDPRTFNLKYDYLSAHKSKIAVQWVREMAHSLAQAAHVRNSIDIELEDTPIDGWFWVADPNVIQALREAVRYWTSSSLAITNAPPILLQEHLGAIVLEPGSFECRGREFHGKWDVLAKFEYTLYVDWSKVKAYAISRVPVSGLSVELADTYH